MQNHCIINHDIYHLLGFQNIFVQPLLTVIKIKETTLPFQITSPSNVIIARPPQHSKVKAPVILERLAIIVACRTKSPEISIRFWLYPPSECKKLYNIDNIMKCASFCIILIQTSVFATIEVIQQSEKIFSTVYHCKYPTAKGKQCLN